MRNPLGPFRGYEHKNQPRLRRHRQILGAISLILWINNFDKMRELRSEVDQLRQNHQHIVQGIKHLATAVWENHQDIQALQRALLRVESVTNWKMYESTVLSATQEVEPMAHHHLHAVECMVEGIYTAVGEKLSPPTIDAQNLETALEYLQQKMGERQYEMIGEASLHIL